MIWCLALLFLTQLNASAASSFVSTICSCRSIEYATMVPFGWPPKFVLSASFPVKVVLVLIVALSVVAVTFVKEDSPVDVADNNCK